MVAYTVTVPAMRTRVVRGEGRADHELSPLQRCDPAANLLDNAAVRINFRHGRDEITVKSGGAKMGALLISNGNIEWLPLS
jgi:hypothetical protein